MLVQVGRTGSLMPRVHMELELNGVPLGGTKKTVGDNAYKGTLRPTQRFLSATQTTYVFPFGVPARTKYMLRVRVELALGQVRHRPRDIGGGLKYLQTVDLEKADKVLRSRNRTLNILGSFPHSTAVASGFCEFDSGDEEVAA